MLALHIFHQHIIGLIQHIRTVSIRAVIRQIAVLIHICIDGDNSILRILCIEGINQLLEISLLDCGIVLQNPDRDIVLQLAAVDIAQRLRRGRLRARLCLSLSSGGLRLPISAAAAEKPRAHHSCHHQCNTLLFHFLPPYPRCSKTTLS